MGKNLLWSVFAAAAVLLAGCGVTNDGDEIISYVKNFKVRKIDPNRTFEQAISSNLANVSWKLENGRLVTVSGIWKQDELFDDDHKLIVAPNDSVTVEFEYKVICGLFGSTRFKSARIRGDYRVLCSHGLDGKETVIKFKGGFLGVLFHKK